MDTYIYTCMYVYICMCIYMYVYIHLNKIIHQAAGVETKAQKNAHKFLEKEEKESKHRQKVAARLVGGSAIEQIEGKAEKYHSHGSFEGKEEDSPQTAQAEEDAVRKRKDAARKSKEDAEKAEEDAATKRKQHAVVNKIKDMKKVARNLKTLEKAGWQVDAMEKMIDEELLDASTVETLTSRIGPSTAWYRPSLVARAVSSMRIGRSLSSSSLKSSSSQEQNEMAPVEVPDWQGWDEDWDEDETGQRQLHNDEKADEKAEKASRRKSRTNLQGSFIFRRGDNLAAGSGAAGSEDNDILTKTSCNLTRTPLGSSSIHDNQQGQEKGAGALKMLATAASFKTTVAFKIPRKKTQEKDAGVAIHEFLS